MVTSLGNCSAVRPMPLSVASVVLPLLAPSPLWSRTIHLSDVESSAHQVSAVPGSTARPASVGSDCFVNSMDLAERRSLNQVARPTRRLPREDSRLSEPVASFFSTSAVPSDPAGDRVREKLIPFGHLTTNGSRRAAEYLGDVLNAAMSRVLPASVWS